MREASSSLKRFEFGRFTKVALIAAGLLATLPAISFAQQKGEKTYASPEEASQALVAAAQKNDEAAMLEILGPDGKKIVSSGDTAEDQQARADFVKNFQVMHRFVKEPDDSTTLYIGAENWPSPIPLMEKDGKWYFDTVSGKREILYRRIGKNELSAIRVCEELVAAQKEYFAHEGNQYAQKFMSAEGKQDGLYWTSADQTSESPVGPLVANAGSDSTSAAEPFRGYYFRILDAQGKDASGGAMSYEADGKMTKGFAFVAYPAVYRDSGVMTFIVGQDGVVYQKDLGKATAARVKSMKDYDPDSTWKKAEESEQSADNQKTE
jgi:hypothetical protein